MLRLLFCRGLAAGWRSRRQLTVRAVSPATAIPVPMQAAHLPVRDALLPYSRFPGGDLAGGQAHHPIP